MKIGKILSLWLDVERMSGPLRADLTRNNVLKAMMLEPWIIWAVNQLGGTATFQQVYKFLDDMGQDAPDIPLYLATDSLLLKGKLVGGKLWYGDDPPVDHRTQVLTTTGTKKAIDVVDAPESVYRRLNIMMPPRRE